MRIKNFLQFISEEVSGTELVGNVSVGPAFGETRLQNKTINQKHTSTINVPGEVNPNSKNSMTQEIFFDDEYQEIYNTYLKSGGSQNVLTNDKSKDLSIMLQFLDEKNI